MQRQAVWAGPINLIIKIIAGAIETIAGAGMEKVSFAPQATLSLEPSGVLAAAVKS